MKHTAIAAAFLLSVVGSSCGDMSNNTNENHSVADSTGTDYPEPENPNTSNAPLRDTFSTDIMSPTAGPDNAAPKSSATDTTPSTGQR